MTFNVSAHTDTQGPRKKKDSRQAMLEEEIRLLREQMETGIASEQSFTSEMAIRLSSELDAKINEYHDYLRRLRR